MPLAVKIARIFEASTSRISETPISTANAVTVPAAYPISRIMAA